MDAGDAPVLATDLPGDPAGIKEPVVAIYLVLTFGFAGSPGAWQAWSEATRIWHCARGPADPKWNGPEAFDSTMLVDDAVLVEPCLGIRPELSAAA